MLFRILPLSLFALFLICLALFLCADEQTINVANAQDMQESPLYQQRLTAATEGFDGVGYIYAGNNPANHTDPTGEAAISNSKAASSVIWCTSTATNSQCWTSGCSNSQCSGTSCIGSICYSTSC